MDFSGVSVAPVSNGNLSSESSVSDSDPTFVSFAMTTGSRIGSIVVLRPSDPAQPSGTSDVDRKVYDSGLLTDEPAFINEFENRLSPGTRKKQIYESGYDSLPPSVQVFVNDIHQHVQEGGGTEEEVYAVSNSINNDLLLVLICVPRPWEDIVDVICDTMEQVARSAVGAMTRVEITATEDTRCPICCGEWEAGGDVRMTECSHKYHAPCIEKWLIRDQRRSCPTCRFQIVR